MATRLSQQTQPKNQLSQNNTESNSIPNRFTASNIPSTNNSTVMADPVSVSNNQKIQSSKALHEKFSFRDFSSLELNKCINKLIYGMYIKKSTRKGNGTWHSVYFYIHGDDLSILQWLSDKKPFNQSRIDLKTISNISELPIKTFGSKIDKKSRLLLAIQHARGELVLSFDNEQDKFEWWNGLQCFLLIAYNQFEQTEEKNIMALTKVVSQELIIGDKQEDNKKLDRNEILDALKKMNIYTYKKHANQIFNQIDVEQKGQITYKAFENMVKKISIKEELIPLFKKYCPEFEDDNYEAPLMKIDQFIKFFEIEQNQLINQIQALEIINSTKDKRDLNNENLSFMNFINIVYSESYNSIFNPNYVQLYQDMNRPLVDYYINSSWNIYMNNSQLPNESALNEYAKALISGFRLIELDLWNGNQNEPIIRYDGNPIPLEILFRDICQIVRIHGFENNPFPIILSIEMHCDDKGQKKTAEILQEELGDLIYELPKDFENYDELPSPYMLKNRILIKGKRNIQDEIGQALITDIEAPYMSHQSLKEDDLELKDLNMRSYSNNNNKYINALSKSLGHKPPNNIINGMCDTEEEEEEEKATSIGYQKDYDKNSEAYFMLNKRIQDNIKLNSPLKLNFQRNQELSDIPIRKSEYSEIKYDKQIPNTVDYRTPAFLNGRHLEFDSKISPNLVGDADVNISEENQDTGFNKNQKQQDYQHQLVAIKTHFSDEANKEDQLSFHLEEDEQNENSHNASTQNQVEYYDSFQNLNIKHKGKIIPTDNQKPEASFIIKEDEELSNSNENSTLINLYGLISIKWSLAKPRTIWHISSITESGINDLFKSHYREIIDFHKKYISQINPPGMESLNCNPIPIWNAGIQIIALNCQLIDESIILNYAKFISNGNCGFILKPQLLQHDVIKSNGLPLYPNELIKPVMNLEISIISGKQLRFPQSEHGISKNDGYIHPFVEIKLRGVEIDENANPIFRTHTIKDNGFNPIWSTPQHECKARFRIAAPDLCTLIFYIKNENSNNEPILIGWYAIELKNIMTGYRAIPILDYNFHKIQHSYILCHIYVDEYSHDIKNN